MHSRDKLASRSPPPIVLVASVEPKAFMHRSGRLAIFGCGGMGRELADIAIASGCADLVFVVDAPAGPVNGIPVIGPEDLLPDDRLCFAVGSSNARMALAARFAGQRLANVYARTAIVSPSSLLGEGSVLGDYAVVNNSSTIGKHYQGNTFSQVSHDCIIGDYVTMSPHASCNGWVHIGDGVSIGAGAVLRNGEPDRRLRIGAGAVIGMGAVVVDDVAPGVTVMGNPAKLYSGTKAVR